MPRSERTQPLLWQWMSPKLLEKGASTPPPTTVTTKSTTATTTTTTSHQSSHQPSNPNSVEEWPPLAGQKEEVQLKQQLSSSPSPGVVNERVDTQPQLPPGVLDFLFEGEEQSRGQSLMEVEDLLRVLNSEDESGTRRLPVFERLSLRNRREVAPRLFHFEEGAVQTYFSDTPFYVSDGKGTGVYEKVSFQRDEETGRFVKVIKYLERYVTLDDDEENIVMRCREIGYKKI